ncbi:hypothetical protein [Brevibacterium linens]|uniref:Uncharacterized protein n=1 Tax=Brevibacterium linens TaxID=1703 RepID=A0A0B9ATF3_BRELN|nr:hypothetical protein [Brevibacterium linens]KHS54183.1 hypothetical protein AE0388_0007 [Brevibacterium linens]
MALYPVPWFTTGGIEGEGGAENYGELARAATYAGTMAATGIIEPADFRVTALPTPGAAVRVHKGSAVIKSTYPGVFGQSYVVQERDYTDVPVAATGSSGGATKYVYLLIEDTQFTGQPPESVEDGPYNSYHVTTTLPQFQPYLLLAKINQPASRADIQPSMIEDLREVANPIVGQFTFARPRLMADDDPRQNLLTARFKGANGEWYGEYFPGGDGSPNETRQFIPQRATHMSVRADWLAIRGVSGLNCHGRYWLEYGDEYRNHTWPGGRQLEFATQQFAFDTTGTQGSYRLNWALMDQVPIPKKLRGKTIRFAFKAGVSDDADRDGVMMNALSGLGLDVTFSMAPVDSDTI